MFFRSHLTSVCDILEAKYRGSRYAKQNSADIGELCEALIQFVLDDFLSGQFFIQRGGKIVDVNESMSRQFDVILTAKNTLRIFREKGLYPTRLWQVSSASRLDSV